MKIAIVNAWSDDNKGDAAIVEGLIRSLTAESSEPVEFTLVSMFRSAANDSPHYRHTRRLTEHVSVRPALLPVDRPAGRWRRPRRVVEFIRSLLLLAFGRGALEMLPDDEAATLRALAEVDLVVSKGGHIYFSGGTLKSVLGLYRNLFPILLAQRLGRPTVVYGQSIGPVRGLLQRAMVRRALSGLDGVYVREPASQAVVRDLGVNSVRLCWDSAFGLPTEPLPRHVESVLPERFVGLTVRQWMFPYGAADGPRRYEEYLRALVGVIERLWREHGLRVVVVPQAIGPTPMENDLVAADMLRARLGGNSGTVFLDDDLTAGQLSCLYGRAVFVLATRFHSAILAMSKGTPAVSISYHGPKAPGIMKMLGLERYVADISTVREQEIWTRCEELLADRCSIVAQLQRYQREIERASSATSRELLEMSR